MLSESCHWREEFHGKRTVCAITMCGDRVFLTSIVLVGHWGGFHCFWWPGSKTGDVNSHRRKMFMLDKTETLHSRSLENWKHKATCILFLPVKLKKLRTLSLYAAEAVYERTLGKAVRQGFCPIVSFVPCHFLFLLI